MWALRVTFEMTRRAEKDNLSRSQYTAVQGKDLKSKYNEELRLQTEMRRHGQREL